MQQDRWLLGWGLASVAVGGASVLVPLYVVALGGDALALGVLASAAAFAGVPGALVIGRLADQPGHRRLLLVSTLLLVAAAAVGIALVPSIPLAIAFNAVLWFAAAAAVPVATVLVTVDIPANEWGARIGTVNAAQGWGWLAGLVLGVGWTAVGRVVLDPRMVLRTNLIAIGVCAAAGAAVAARSLSNGTGGGRRPRQFARAIAGARRRALENATFPFTPGRLYWLVRSIRPRRLLARTDRTLGLYLLAVGLFFTGFAVFFAPLPAFLTDIGYDSTLVFVLYVVTSLGSALTYDAAGKLTRHHDATLLQTAALIVRALAFPSVALTGAILSTSTAGLVVSAGTFLIIGIGWAIVAVTGGTIVTQLTPPAIHGEMLGVYAGLSALAGGVGGILGGWIATTSYQLAFLVAGILIFVGALFVVVVRQLIATDRSTQTAGRKE